MFETIKVLREAKRIVDDSQHNCWSRDSLPANCGLHLPDDYDPSSDLFKETSELLARDFPYRTLAENKKHLRIHLANEDVISSGNELENDINGSELSPEAWYSVVYEAAKQYGWDATKLASPALMTLKQRKDFWPKIIKHENFFKYWCLNSHMKGYLSNHEGGLGDYWELIKCTAELIKFKNATKKKVIITECGNGESHLALTKPDMKLLYLIHEKVFGDRLEAVLFYQINYVYNHNGIELLK